MIIPKAKASIDGICQITRADLDHPNKNQYQEQSANFSIKSTGKAIELPRNRTKETKLDEPCSWRIPRRSANQIQQREKINKKKESNRKKTFFRLLPQPTSEEKRMRPVESGLLGQEKDKSNRKVRLSPPTTLLPSLRYWHYSEALTSNDEKVGWDREITTRHRPKGDRLKPTQLNFHVHGRDKSQ